MGLIYRIISPSGKKYVGQTIKSFNHRMNQHKNSAARGNDEHCCRRVNRAIRKYGWASMVKEIIVECEDHELNELEIMMIEQENSLHPNGYNLTPGGAGCVYLQTTEIKTKRSNSLRRRDNTKGLPMYAKYRNTKFGEGFIYEKPGCKAVQFTSPHLSMEEKRAALIEFVEEFNNNPDLIVDMKRKKVFPFKVAKYISYQTRIKGFVVNKPNFPRKTCSDKKLSDEENYAKAKEYLDTLI